MFRFVRLKAFLLTALVSAPSASVYAQAVNPNQNSFVMGTPSGGNKGYGTINATGLYINGVAVGSGGITIPSAPLLSGNGSTLGAVTAIENVPIGDVTPATGAFTTLSASLNISQGGVAVIGTNIVGAVAGQSIGPAVVVNTPSYDYSTVSGNVRNNQFTTTLAPSANTSVIWENDYSAVILNGPGVANGEVNTGHFYVQVNSGASFQTGENVETSTYNQGIVNGIGSYTALYNNTSAATTTFYKGLSGSLTNSNTNAGAIGNYVFLYLGTMGGGGSLPTNYYFMQNADANAGSALAGHLAVGNIGVGQAWLEAKGPDTSISTWLFDLENSAGTHLMLTRDDGSTAVSGAWSFGSTSSPGKIIFYNAAGGNESIVANTSSASSYILTMPALATGNDTFAVLGTPQTYTAMLTMGSSGGITYTSLPSGTPATYACFTSGGLLVSSALAC